MHPRAVLAFLFRLLAQVAEELTHTCWQMYHQMPSGARSFHTALFEADKKSAINAPCQSACYATCLETLQSDAAAKSLFVLMKPHKLNTACKDSKQPMKGCLCESFLKHDMVYSQQKYSAGIHACRLLLEACHSMMVK